MDKITVRDPFNNIYVLTVERDRIQSIYHEGWRRDVEIHNVQACLLTEVVDDVPVEGTRLYVTLEGMVVKMSKERLESIDKNDLESILTLGELLDFLNDSLYTTTPIY